MANNLIRSKLDTLIKTTTSFESTNIPADLIDAIHKWKWGEYGWVSPASLIFTAAWRKYFYPSADCCKIWAEDESGTAIADSYSIRTEDETISIPLLSKYDLCKGFCSDNSGMQGSRAIEKMRGLKRLDENFSVAQKTVFDLKLFASIMNKINKLNEKQSLEVIKQLIVIAKRIQIKRKDADAKLADTNAIFDVLGLLDEIEDPELSKCIAAACLTSIYHPHGLILDGIMDHKTAADARAEKPGDIALLRDGNVIIATEVKDKSIKLDWQNIGRAEKIISSYPSIELFIFVLGNRSAIASDIVQEIIRSGRLLTSIGNKIAFMSLHDLYRLAISVKDQKSIIRLIGEYLSKAPSVKPTTKDIWISKASTN